MPAIPYGIGTEGAASVGFSSGREMFRCGSYVRVYITNVTADVGTTTIGCEAPSDIGTGNVCIVSAQGNYRDQMAVNWGAKNGASSDLPNGSVINKVMACGTGDSKVYTHTEGQVSVRIQCPITVLATPEDAQAAALSALVKLTGISEGIPNDGWVVSDISVQASPNDWQGGNVSLAGISSTGSNAKARSYKVSYNYQNGMKEMTDGELKYDTGDTQAMISVIKELYGA